MVYLCYTCDQSFYDDDDLRDHLSDYDWHEAQHDYARFGCNTCLATFNSDAARWQHMNAKGHAGYECGVCDNRYRTQKDCTNHEVEYHNYCADCNKFFQNTNNIKQHLNSRLHRGQTMECPFCRNNFTTATGLTHHLESSGCRNAPSLNRDRIYQIVRQKDPSGLISKNLIGWTGGESNPNRYKATDRAWNGRGWACALCSKVMTTRDGLDKHLNSPAHYSILYHCPNNDCPSEFKTLAAIINHLESESCRFMGFDAVQKQMGQVVTSGRMIAF